MKDERQQRAGCKSIGINLSVLLPPVPQAQRELRSMQMCAIDRDLKRVLATDAVLLSTCTQHQLRLDIELDLKGAGGDGVYAQTCDGGIGFCIITQEVHGEEGRAGATGATGAAEAAGAAGAAVQEGQESNPSMNKRRQEFISRDSIITRTGAEREIVF